MCRKISADRHLHFLWPSILLAGPRNIPLIAAQVGSMAELLKDHSEWLFNPDDASNMVRVLENRLGDRRTGYKKVLSWSDVATELEKIFINLCKDKSLS